MKNLKYLANQISEKLNYWKEKERINKLEGYPCDWEKGHADAYSFALELIEQFES